MSEFKVGDKVLCLIHEDIGEVTYISDTRVHVKFQLNNPDIDDEPEFELDKINSFIRKLTKLELALQ